MDIPAYNAARGIYSPLVEHNGAACGCWLCGNDYRNKSRYYGAYPPNYLRRIKLLFPQARRVLHLFSGKVQTGFWPEEVTFDVNPELQPTYVGDAEQASIVIGDRGGFDLILADPPYDDNYVRYGTKRCNKRLAVKQVALLLRMGGHLVWLDTIIPMWAKADGWKFRGAIGLVQSTNHKARVITILEKAR